MDSKVALIALGQRQGPKATKAVDEEDASGGWVVLQNCHLTTSYIQHVQVWIAR